MISKVSGYRANVTYQSAAGGQQYQRVFISTKGSFRIGDSSFTLTGKGTAQVDTILTDPTTEKNRLKRLHPTTRLDRVWFKKLNKECVCCEKTAGKIFPGLKMFCGSSACFSARMASIASGPSSALRYFCLPCPMPCSPVQVPPIACARSTTPMHEVLAARHLFAVIDIA